LRDALVEELLRFLTARGDGKMAEAGHAREQLGPLPRAFREGLTGERMARFVRLSWVVSPEHCAGTERHEREETGGAAHRPTLVRAGNSAKGFGLGEPPEIERARASSCL